jgi:hypothetical protein
MEIEAAAAKEALEGAVDTAAGEYDKLKSNSVPYSLHTPLPSGLPSR